MPSVTWVRLDPLDTISPRDGRPFRAGSADGAAAIVPTPFTVTGALCRAFAVRELAWVAGPCLVDARGELLFPAPRDLAIDPIGVMTRLRPRADANVQTDLGEMRLVSGEGDSQEGWVASGDLARYLADVDIDHISIDSSAMLKEVHVGLYRNEGRCAADGFLYSSEHLRLGAGVGFAARAGFDSDAPVVEELVPLGGERRLAHVGTFSPSGVPDRPADFPGGRLAVYLATPAIFADGWKPPTPEGARLVAAAVDGPRPISSWGRDDDGQPGFRLRWAVASGSVYFYEFGDPAKAQVWASRAHDRCLFQGHGRFRTAGLGWAFMGRW